MGGQHWNHSSRSNICTTWEPFGLQLYIMKLPLFQDYFHFISGSHILEFIFTVIEFYQYGTYMGLIGAKCLYRALVGPKWNKWPDSIHMGPKYTCLLGIYRGWFELVFESVGNSDDSSRKQILNCTVGTFYHRNVCCAYSLDSPHGGNSISTLNKQIFYRRSKPHP